jgi:uncharacterized protein (TIGR03066 family)
VTALRLMAAGLFLVGLAVGVRAEEKKDSNKEKIVGTWEWSKSDEGFSAVYVFSKDGKVKLTGKKDGKEEIVEGTYSVEGDKVTVALKFGDNEEKHTFTIKKLTDTEMVAFDEKKGKSLELKRKK